MRTPIQVVVTGPEEAYDDHAELWHGNVLVAVTILHEGRLHLRVDARSDGEPWLLDCLGLSEALAEAARKLAAY